MRFLLFALLLCINLSVGPAALAGSSADNSKAIIAMANIMRSLNHYPNAESKKELKMIIENKSTNANERVLATAIMNLKHQVSADDVPALKKILGNNNAANNERTLASIILNLNHRPAAAEKEALGKMIH
jgi:hypothetical protein